MSLAEELELLRARGFDEDRAQIIVLMREAAILLFQAFPDSFLLYGGANLILFHDSLRTSRDLDLLSQDAALPKAEDVTRVLSDGLQELGKLLGIAPLRVKVEIAKPAFLKLEVASKDDRSLFTVDLGGLGSVLKSGIEEHAMEAVSLNMKATIRSVSRDHLLLQKAEAFVFRPGVKARDAYDIKLLLDAGGTLSGELENHLTDALTMREIGREELIARIEQVTARLCRGQLADVLRAEEYRALERADFQPLRSAVQKLFQTWL
jgi:hypothetical protein